MTIINLDSINRNSMQILLFSLLSSFAFLGSIFKIPLIFGYNIVFSSVFFLMIAKMFDIKWVLVSGIIVNALIFIYIDQSLNPVVYLLEMYFAGIGYLFKKKNLILIDMIFWAAIGMPVLGAWYRVIGIDNIYKLYPIVTMAFINGLANAVIADIFTSYKLLYKIFKIKKEKYQLYTLSLFLFRISMVCILGPFLFFIVISSWSIKKSTIQEAYMSSKIEGERIKHDVDWWFNKEDSKYLKKSEIQRIISSPMTMQLEIIAINDLGEIIMPNNMSNEMSPPLNLNSNSNLNPINSKNQINTSLIDINSGLINMIYKNFYQWIPKNQTITYNNFNSLDNALFIYEFESNNIKFLIKVPAAKYTHNILESYFIYFRSLIIFLIPVVFVILVLSRNIIKSHLKLTIVTTDLPRKLQEKQDIEWPTSNIYEADALISNFKIMSQKLSEMFNEFRIVNESLKQKTEQLTKSEDKLRNLAYFDNLTKLPNRLCFNKFLSEMIESFKETDSSDIGELAVMFIDLDRFKQINDTLGHSKGDMLLKEVSNKLVELLGSSHDENHFIARLGGDEFVIVFKSTDEKQAAKLAKSIIDTINKPNSLIQYNFNVGASIGVSFYPSDGKNVEDILKYADISMYAAKEAGGNTYCFYNQISKNAF